MTQESAIPAVVRVTSALVVSAGVWLVLRGRLLKEKEKLQTPVHLIDQILTVVYATRRVPKDGLETDLCAAKSEWEYRASCYSYQTSDENSENYEPP